MYTPAERIETSTATLQRVSPDVVVLQYKPGVTITADVVAENIAARKTLPGDRPYALIVIIPEDADFRMSLLSKDHFKGMGLDTITRALAVVAEDSFFHSMAKLYFAHFPPGFHFQVFHNLPDANRWVGERMEERAAS